MCWPHRWFVGTVRNRCRNRCRNSYFCVGTLGTVLLSFMILKLNRTVPRVPTQKIRVPTTVPTTVPNGSYKPPMGQTHLSSAQRRRGSHTCRLHSCDSNLCNSMDASPPSSIACAKSSSHPKRHRRARPPAPSGSADSVILGSNEDVHNIGLLDQIADFCAAGRLSMMCVPGAA